MTGLRILFSLCTLMLVLCGFAAAETRLAVLGDSLTAGYGLSPGDSFPEQLEAALRARGYAVSVINAGVSGDTTAGGLARLGWTLADRPHAMIVELGANDALRGMDPAETRSNLAAILQQLTAAEVPVLLAGMRAPRNFGAEFSDRFDRIFPELAREYNSQLYPFFLEGVAGVPELNLPDGIHPNPRGVALIVREILPRVEELLRRVPAPTPGSK